MQKTAVITGATSGIGFEAAKQLAQKGFKIVQLARNEEKAKHTTDQLIAGVPGAEVSYVICDLADLQSVKAAATALQKKVDRIDVLLNNAGGVFYKEERSVDGFEMHYAANHLGHFHLTTLLLPLLLKSKSRIINVSSEAHRLGKIDFEELERNKGFTDGLSGYGSAKLCNILFTKELHRRYHNQGLSSFALHPGVVSTNFGLNTKGWLKPLVKAAQVFMISAEKGAETSVYLASEPGIENLSGSYFKRKKPVTPSANARSEKDAVRLWEASTSSA